MEGKNKMHRRCFHHDYRSRRIYMLTMTVEGRRPLLGSLKVSDGVAAVELSPLGQEVERSLLGLPGYYPELQVLAQQVMPDHVHVIVFVERELPRHLGQVVAGFKYGTTRAMRELLTAAKPRPTQPHHAAHQPACYTGRGGGEWGCVWLGSAEPVSASVERGLPRHDRVARGPTAKDD